MRTETEIVTDLREIADAIAFHDNDVFFPSLFPVDSYGITNTEDISEALNVIRNGGPARPEALSGLVHYIADMMEA